MRLVESVQDVTLGGLRKFIEQAERSGASAETPVEMTRARNGGVLTIAVDFEPTPFLASMSSAMLRPGTYTVDDDPSRAGIALAGEDEKEAQ